MTREQMLRELVSELRSKVTNSSIYDVDLANNYAARQIEAVLNSGGDGWLPIESAPKDGGEIIVYCDDTNEQFVVYWRPDEEVWCYAISVSGIAIHCTPTHWRNVHAAPTHPTEDKP